MRIIGIDPGLGATGIGIVEVFGERCTHVHHSVIRTRSDASTLDRLQAIHDGVRDLALRWEAESGAIEASFVGENARSALALGQARAAALLGLAACNLPVAEYTPAVVKQTVAGYGRGGKAQVGEMVRLQLSLSTVPSPPDAADALAVAITHWAHSRHAGLH